MRQTVAKFNGEATRLLKKRAATITEPATMALFDALLNADQSTQAGIEEQRQRVDELKELLERDGSPEGRRLLSLADYLVRKTVWAIGGDGWGYDIGYGGVDHVLASGEDVNILILDTEVYSNTGGQMSKSTPMGASVQFAAGGKRTPKKSIGLIMTTYGYVYVAQVAYGANPAQTLRALVEAESYHGPSLVVAYATCIAQGIDMGKGIQEMRNAVACGHWPLFRYNPDRTKEGKNPFVLDSGEPTMSFEEYAYRENRFRTLRMSDPETAKELMKRAQEDVNRRWSYLRHLSNWTPPGQ
jgi:pyruvate-ferredoxin/flavodoxin oxidoreductase